MTPEQQRIAIAEWMGWSRSYQGHSGFNTKTSQREIVAVEMWFNEAESRGPHYIEDIPNYPNDLNAMHEAEKKLDADSDEDAKFPSLIDFSDYERELKKVMIEDDKKKDKSRWTPLWHATSLQRAEALCRTLWPEKWT